MKGVFLLAHGHTNNINLLKLDPTVKPMSLSDLRAFFETNQDTIDANIKALFDRIEAVAAAGYTPVSPVETGSRLMFRVENAANHLDLPAILASLPGGTFVRVTGFTFALRSEAEATAFMNLLDTLNGLDASNGGLDKAQMNGTIRLERSDTSTGTPVTVSGALLTAWTRRYPSITVIPERIVNNVYYYNYAGTELLRTETVYDNADAVYDEYPTRESAQSGYSYIFLGWSDSVNSVLADATLTNVSKDLTVYAAHQLIEDIRPTISVRRYASAIGGECVVDVTDWGSYSKVVSMSSVSAAGKAIKTNVGDGIASFDAETNAVSITATAEYFTGVLEWALNFADSRERGGLTCSVSFRLKNLPVVSVRKKSTESGDPIIIDVSSFGDYGNVTEFGYKAIDVSNSTATPVKRTVTGASNNHGTIATEDGVVTITPKTSTSYAIFDDKTSYVIFSNTSGTDTVTLVLDMFDIGT